MGLIYVLQKDIPGLGVVTKIGMTAREGASRAKEYGGGGWVCIKEYPVAVDDPVELRTYEARIHERLKSVKCKEAEGFGLTEVFTCSPEIAMAVVKDVVGREPSIDEEVARLKRTISKGVVSRLRKQYEAKYTKIIKEGKYRPGRGNYGGDYSIHAMFCGLDGGLLRLAGEFLDALDSSGEDDPVFRALLESEIRELEPKCQEILARMGDDSD